MGGLKILEEQPGSGGEHVRCSGQQSFPKQYEYVSTSEQPVRLVEHSTLSIKINKLLSKKVKSVQ